jgi:hypothetical protein
LAFGGSLGDPVLNLASPQGRNSFAILRLVEEIVQHDSEYVERLKAHYDLFRRRVEGDLGDPSPELLAGGGHARGAPEECHTSQEDSTIV